MNRFVKACIIFIATFLVSFTSVGVAFAATDDTQLMDMAKPLLDAVMHGQFALAGAMLLVLGVALARRYGAKRFPFLHTDAGGSLLTLAGSFGGAVATALMAGAGVTTGLLWTALGVAATASGGYTLIKRLAIPLLKKVLSKLPKALQKPFGLVLWMFESPKVAAAEAAGDAAVAANPAKGLGTPDELP